MKELNFKKIIPWTIDADVSMFQNDLPILDKYLYLHNSLEEKGWILFPDNTRPKFIRMCAHPTRSRFKRWEIPKNEKQLYQNFYPYIDLYLAMRSITNGKKVISVRYAARCTFLEETIFPLSTVYLYGTPLYAPHNVSQYLYQVYGDDWMYPPPESKKTLHGSYKNNCQSERQPK